MLFETNNKFWTLCNKHFQLSRWKWVMLLSSYWEKIKTTNRINVERFAKFKYSRNNIVKFTDFNESTLSVSKTTVYKSS